jgi:hypothetical protein
MSGWTEKVSLRPYNIKTGTVTIPVGQTTYDIDVLGYTSNNYTVSITPKFAATVIPYVTNVTSTKFTVNGNSGDYYWMTITTS